MDHIQLNQEQQQALELMLSGKNVFLTGEAGTGKSTILREFREQTKRECVFLAPTGIAAINVNGATLHSFFLLKPGLLTADSIEEIGSKKRRALIRKAKTIVIDEISMVRSDVFHAIDFRLRSLAQGGSQQKPFGGKQIILVGDFYQLPPVVKTETEDAYLRHELGGYYAFQTTLWSAAKFSCVFLKTVHRQQNDNLFLSILNQIRHGRLSEENIRLSESPEPLNALEALNKLCVNQPALNPEPIYLCTTNQEAQTINMTRKSQLDGKNVLFRAIVSGKFRESDYPTSPILELKTGARIMLLNNKRYPTGEFEYVNGDVGTITSIASTILPMVNVELDNGRCCCIQPYRWTTCEYELEVDQISGKEIIRQKEVGTFVQLPLKLAYAVTIHKAQGLSLERVHLKLGGGCFAHGQLYTALSRCRAIQNLRLDRPLFAEDVLLDENVLEFYRIMENPVLPKKEVVLTVPKKHEAAVLALLAKLQQGETPDVEEFKTEKIIHSSPLAEDSFAIPASKEPDIASQPIENKIYNHTDIDKLIIVYRNQTGMEKSEGSAKRQNGIGFNKIDAPILTPIAEKYQSQGFIWESELKIVSFRIQKYRKQWDGKINLKFYLLPFLNLF